MGVRWEGGSTAVTRDVPYTWVNTRKKAKAVIKELKKHPVAAIDTEFPIMGDRRHEVIIWSISVAADVNYVITGELMPLFTKWLEAKRYKKVWWNYKEDADVIEDFSGLNLDDSFHADGMVMDWSVDETDIFHNLKHSGEKHLNWKRKGYADTFCYVPEGKKKALVLSPEVLMEGPLPDEMLIERSHKEWIKLFKQYAANDAAQTYLLFRKLRKILKKRGYWDEYLRVDAPFTVTLRHCQGRGVTIDMDKLKGIYRDVDVRMMRLAHLFRQQAGVPDEFNIQSRDQLSALFFDELDWPTWDDLRTDTGAPQLNEPAIRRYINDHGFELAATLQKYNKLKTKRGTFLKGMIQGVEFGRGKEESILYSDFNQIAALTGRISSRKYEVLIEFWKHFKTVPSKLVTRKVKAGMNLQNIPNVYNDDLGIRSVFIPPPGYVMLVADYSGFELWMMLWNCHKFGIKSKMLDALLAGKDVHSMTAVALCNLDCHWSEVKELYPDKRNSEGKRSNFNLLYGGQAKMLASIMGWDIRDERMVRKAQRMIDGWMELWPEMPLVQEALVDHAYEYGYATTIGGRRTHLKHKLEWKSRKEDREEARSEEWRVRNHAENIAKNSPCQGSAADIMKEAMNLIDKDEELAELGYQQLFPVHDEVVGICPKSTADEALARKIHLMQQPQKDKLPFDLIVEGGKASNWLLAK